MIGLLTGLSQATATAGLGRGQGERTIIIAGSTGDVAAQATAQALERMTQRPPRILVTEGHRFHVYVNRDVHLPPSTVEAVTSTTSQPN